jgi:DNA-binding NarL/FixJ family response regulator
MQHNQTIVCVAAPPGRLRDSLRVILRMNQTISLAGEADTGAAGLDMLRDLHPDLFLIDASLPEEEAWDLLAHVHQHQPQLNCCIIVHSIEEEFRARSSGSEMILQAGFSANTFWETVLPH